MTDLDQTEFHDNKTKTDQINVKKAYYALDLFFLASYYGKLRQINPFEIFSQLFYCSSGSVNSTQDATITRKDPFPSWSHIYCDEIEVLKMSKVDFSYIFEITLVKIQKLRAH